MHNILHIYLRVRIIFNRYKVISIKLLNDQYFGLFSEINNRIKEMKRRELLSVIKQNGMFSNDLIPKLIEEVQKHSDNEDTETLRNTLRLFIVKL